MQSITIFLLLLSTTLWAETYPAKMRKLVFNEGAFKSDLERILADGKLPETMVQVVFKNSLTNNVEVRCIKDEFYLEVAATEEERGPTFYKGLRELGFLFPHPVKQITPTLERMKESCGKSYTWRPTLKYRGFHLHTLHPSEWVHAFFMGESNVAIKTIRWMARNGQNAFDIILLRRPLEEIKKNLPPLFHLAESLGIHTGLSLGIAVQQQKTYHLLNLWETLFDSSDALVTERLSDILKGIPLSYVVLEAGSSEFTPTNYERTIRWLNLAGNLTSSRGVALFTKIHVSTNQHDKKYGNFNFLPQYCLPSVGIWPHTVFTYGLLDRQTPIYGNKNFDAIRTFMLEQKDKRPTWYYPETGYWIGLDQDIPLLHTEYLRARAEDMAWLNQEHFEGQVNFTTGHALAGWLYDWNLALITDADYNFSPTIGVQLLGEDAALWRSHLSFQKLWFKDRQLNPLLTSANLQDELSTHRIHDRYLMRELKKNPAELAREIKLLEDAWKEWPSIDGILDEELRGLMLVTKLRHEHALLLRRAISGINRPDSLEKARLVREKAAKMIAKLETLPTNYPLLPIFKLHQNPTSYQFGYVYLAHSLYFWEREENQVREDSLFTYWPFTGNIIDWWEILF